MGTLLELLRHVRCSRSGTTLPANHSHPWSFLRSLKDALPPAPPWVTLLEAVGMECSRLSTTKLVLETRLASWALKGNRKLHLPLYPSSLVAATSQYLLTEGPVSPFSRLQGVGTMRLSRSCWTAASRIPPDHWLCEQRPRKAGRLHFACPCSRR